MTKLTVEQCVKLSDSELDQQFDRGTIEPATYREAVRARASNRKAREFRMSGTDKGQIQIQTSYEQFPKCFDVESLVQIIDAQQLARDFIKVHGETLKAKRKAHRASDAYKAECAARRDAFKASKSAS